MAGTRLFDGAPISVADAIARARDFENIEPPEQQLRSAMRSAGIDPPDTLLFDGQVHRFDIGPKRNNKAGWYVAHADGIPAGRFGNWYEDSGRDGIAWRANIGRQLTPAEEQELLIRQKELREARRAAIDSKHAEAAEQVKRLWESFQPATAEHPYIAAKGIQPHIARVDNYGRLVVPLYQPEGQLSSLQYIALNEDGTSEKRFHTGAKMAGGFCVIGNVANAAQVYMAEGYATGATIHEVTGDPVVVAYSAHQLVTIAKTIREHLPHLPLTIVADNDESEVGISCATQAAATVGARYVMPPRPEGEKHVDANDYHRKGYDLLKLLEPSHDDFLTDIREFIRQPAPIRWLIKKWLQRNALAMLVGASGSGKTMAIVDWASRIASYANEWAGYPIHGGPVVYLAGEGHAGLVARFAAWNETYHPEVWDMHISKHGVDLDTSEGLCKARDAIRLCPKQPCLIIVDTLHRHMAGDENKTQDAGKLIKACAALQHEFGATVLLVHHTGVSEDAQNRARGASAFKGALENQIILSREKEYIKLLADKVKDDDDKHHIYCKLEPVELPGWFDEDGEQVSSVVCVHCDPPGKPDKRYTDNRDAMQYLRRCWFATGCDTVDADGIPLPYFTRAAAYNWMIREKIPAGTASNKLQEDKGDFIKPLTTMGAIRRHNDGWIVTDGGLASVMLMARGSDA